MRKTSRITVSIDNTLLYHLNKKAAELDVSISALTAAYAEKGLYDESTARFNEQLEELLKRLDQIYPSDSIGSKFTKADSGSPALPLELQAFMMEVLLYLKALTKNDVGTRGDIAAEVRKRFGDHRMRI